MIKHITDRPTPTYSGSLNTRRMQIAGFNVMDAIFPPGMVCGVHYHEQPSVAVVLQGSISKTYAHGKYTSTDNSLYTTPSGERHELAIGEQGLRLLIMESARGEQPSQRLGARLFQRVLNLPLPSLGLLARQTASELRQADDFSALVIDGLVSAMLAAALRGENGATLNSKRPAWLDRVEQRMHDEPGVPGRISELAAEVGVHPVHLIRVFRHHHGTTPGAYLRSRRLHWAAAQLVNSDEPLGRLSQRAGFSDQSHFTRAFKRQFGVTPGSYRAALNH